MIVCRKAIKEIEPYFNQRLVVRLAIPTPEKILVARLKVTHFLSWVEKYFFYFEKYYLFPFNYIAIFANAKYFCISLIFVLASALFAFYPPQ